MDKIKHIFCMFAVATLLACSSTQVGVAENWIDERDMMALANTPVNEWMIAAGRPSLVEISGDTSIYYYNYKPTMYAVAIYDSMSFFATWGKASEAKPSLANATEIWGSRKNTMQIKVIDNHVINAVVSSGPDKKVFVRDLNGNIILDPNSGFNSNVSAEQKINKDYKEYNNAYNSVSKSISAQPETVAVDSTAKKDAEPLSKNPWEDYRYRQSESQKRADKRSEEEAAMQSSTVVEIPEASR
jgi:hypothetical protein